MRKRILSKKESCKGYFREYGCNGVNNHKQINRGTEFHFEFYYCMDNELALLECAVAPEKTSKVRSIIV